MAETYKHIYKVNLNEPLIRRDVGMIAMFNSKANRIGAEVYRDGVTVDLSGYTVKGYFIRPDEETVPIDGVVSGNMVHVDLPASCYVYDGSFEFALNIKQGDEELTVLKCYGTVERTRTDATANGGEVVVNVTNADKLGGKAPEYYLPTTNLLDNPDFRNPINQRGLTQYVGVSGAAVYAIDRWLTWSVGKTLTVNAGSITLSGSGAYYQNVPIDHFEPGKSYTFVIKYTDGNLLVVSAAYGSSNQYMTWRGADGVGYQVFLFDGELEWAALYEGTYTAATLPPFVPPDPVAELAKCQTYYENSWYPSDKTSQYQIIGSAYSVGRFDCPVFFQQPKRGNANVTMLYYPSDGRATIQAYIKGEYRDVAVETTINRLGRNGVYARGLVTEGDLTAGAGYQLHLHWEASSDL